MKTYAQFILEWIHETEFQIDDLAATGILIPHGKRQEELNERDNNMRLRDDLCDLYFKLTGETYLDAVGRTIGQAVS